MNSRRPPPGDAGAGADAKISASPRLLETLERLLELPSTDLRTTLSHAADLVADATGCDKVDTFLYDATRDSLVAVGVSAQPLSAQQRKLGLDILPRTNGGRVVHVYETGATFITGRLDEDPDELRGIKEALGIRSKLGVPLVIAGVRRGMMMLASLKPDYFTAEDVRLVEAMARWISAVVHRVQVVQDIGRNAAEQARRAAAEELITVLAHDVRNLLAPADIRLDLLRRRAERERRAEDLADLEAVERSVERLRGLVSDILDVARIDQGLFQGNPQPLDLAGLVEETAGTLTSPAHPVRVTVTATDTLTVRGDPARLRQCIENLVVNAIQKSPQDTVVDVQVFGQTREDGEWAIVEVIDQGPGVPDDLRTRIFDRFATGTVREGGLGLGLYLAKQIAVIHGGDLTVDGAPGRGARFVLALPCHG